MPEILTGPASAGFLRDAVIGFYGKIPARGDFVHIALPRAFIDPWDNWMERMIAASRATLGEAWVAAWLEGPVWSFVLSPGTCGPDAVIGLWMPSVDRVGRYFPLTLAAAAHQAGTRELMQEGRAFLTAAEQAGRDALASDLPPEELAARLAAARMAPSAGREPDPVPCPVDGGLWWTEGAPRVPSRMFTSAFLPNENTFVGMLTSCSPMSIVSPEPAR